VFVGPSESFRRRERTALCSALDFAVPAAGGAELASGRSEGGLVDCSASSASVSVPVDSTVGAAEDATEAGVWSEMLVHMSSRDLRLIPRP